MRRRLSFAAAALAVVVPFVGVAAIHGCSSGEFESVCLWVADPDNCYRKFRIDMEGSGNDCKPFGDPTPATPGGDNGTPNGAFLSREMLDVCFINGGGQVVFDPPLDLSKFPPSLLSTPVTYKMSFKSGDGSDCGAATYASPHGFSFTINAPPDGGAADGGGVLIDAGPGDGGPGMPYGSYTQVIQPGSDSFDVTCPTGETHHLDLFEVEGSNITSDGGSESVCPVVQELVPHAEFTVNPGGVDAPGAVSFTIYWPPIGAGVNYPDIRTDAGFSTLTGDAPPVQPVAVTYFNCSIGAAPETCANGAKDGTETDIDCGGKESAPGCPARCGDGQGCVTDCDCDSSLVCTVKSGVKVCGAFGTGGSPSAPPARDCSSYVICSDKQQDGKETDVDCGGTDCVTRCADNQKCLIDGDCQSSYCLNKICTTPKCDNNVKDPGEIDVDCGGPCKLCGNGMACTQNSDCDSGNCVNMKCDVAKCTDMIKNGSETDVDCGGVACPPCANLKACLVNSDCVNMACVNGVCLFPSCSDGVQDGDETDKDCGGTKCGPCADGAGCAASTDCTSGLCGLATPTTKKCFPVSCINDAGPNPCGTTMAGMCPLCNAGDPCMTNADCATNGCVNNACAQPSCSDGVQDGVETDVDCGGGSTCGGCGPGKKCLVDSDCAAFVPDAGADGGTAICINKVCQQ